MSGRNTGYQGEKGFPFSFIQSTDWSTPGTLRHWKEKVRFSQGKWHLNRGLKGVGLDQEGKEGWGWGNSQGSVQWERGDQAPGGLIWGWGVSTELHFRTPLQTQGGR